MPGPHGAPELEPTTVEPAEAGDFGVDGHTSSAAELPAPEGTLEAPIQSWAESTTVSALPRHMEAALGKFMGEEVTPERYQELSADERRSVIADLITRQPSTPDGAPDDIDSNLALAAEAGEVLDELFNRSVAEMGASRIANAEGWVDNLAWVNRAVGSLRTLGLRDSWRASSSLGSAAKITGLIGVGAGTGLVLRTGEHLAGSGGVVGAALGSLGYQQMYQRNLDNRWQRDQSAVKTFASRVTRPLRFLTTPVTEEHRAVAEEEILVADQRRGILPALKRGWRSFRVANRARHEAKAERAAVEEQRVHINPEQVAELPKPQLLQRLAEGRLALTRQDRREQNWRGYEAGERAREVELYSALVKQAALICSAEEVAEAINRTDKWSKAHLALSIGAGAVGAAAGFFGGRWLSGEIKELRAARPTTVHDGTPTTTPLPDNAPLPTDPRMVDAAQHSPISNKWAEDRAAEVLDWRTASAEPSSFELSQASHAVRANILHNLGAGEYRGGEFVLTSDHQFNAAGDGWVMVRVGDESIKLQIHAGKTDLSPLLGRGVITQDQLGEVKSAIANNRIHALQEKITGRNLVREYTGSTADGGLINRAEEIKDQLIQGLVERSETGELHLPASVRQELAAAGYDFNVSDVHSLSDAHREVHQALSHWFKHQVAERSVAQPAAPVHTAPTLGRAPVSVVPHEPSFFERHVFGSPKGGPTQAPVPAPTSAIPVRGVVNVTSSGPRGVLDTVASSGPAPRPYTGWKGPWDQPVSTAPATSVSGIGAPAQPSASLDSVMKPLDQHTVTSAPSVEPRPVTTPVTVPEGVGKPVEFPQRVEIKTPLPDPVTSPGHAPSAKPIEVDSVPLTSHTVPVEAKPAVALPATRPNPVHLSKPDSGLILEEMIHGSRLDSLTAEDVEAAGVPTR